LKIKCPVCGEVKIMKHAFEYHKLINKIHEKMAEYTGKDCRDDPSVSVEHLLKSLLEDNNEKV